MPYYMKAYHLRDLRRFRGWDEDMYHAIRERSQKDSGEQAAAQELADDLLVYVHEDYSVTRTVSPEDVILDGRDPDWQEFCKNELHFEVPDWEAESAAVRQKIAGVATTASKSADSDAPTT